MPVDIVDVNVTTSLAGFPEPSFGAVVVLGTQGTGTVNDPTEYQGAGGVDDDHGTSNDFANAVDEVKARGAETVYGMLLDKTVVADEVIGNSDSTSTSSGTLSGSGIVLPTEKETINVSVDGSSKTVIFTTQDPTTLSLATDEAAVNTKTKDVATGESSSGTGAGIEVDYGHVDMTAGFGALDAIDYEIVLMSETKADEGWLGVLDAIETEVGKDETRAVFATEKAASVTDAQAISTALPASARLAGWAHKSDDDVAAVAAGTMAVVKPWVTLLYKPFTGLAQQNEYGGDQIGDPDTASTFEGGDSNDAGPLNVVARIGGALVSSNGLTLEGSGGTFGGWIDTVRTRDLMVRNIENRLTQLRLNKDKIAFDEGGFGSIRNAIEQELVNLVRKGALSSFSLFIPPADSVSDSNKSSRKLPGIRIEATLAGDVHDFTVELNLTV